MKTQITSLKRGSRMEVGSSYAERMAIAEKVIAENPYGMTVKVHDMVLYLHSITNRSGKVLAYESMQLTSEQVAMVLPFDTKAIEHPELVKVCFRISEEMKCEWSTSRRVRITQEWKAGQTIPVCESDVTIMD